MQKPLFKKSRLFTPANDGTRGDSNDIDALESMEDENDDVVSLEEVEEHTEHDDMSPDSDDAEDEMFMESPIGESFMDDVNEYLREQEEDDDYDDT